MLKPAAKPCLKIGKGADPFAGTYHVGDVFHSPIRRAVIGIRAKHDIVKKKRASVCADALVSDKRLYKISVDSATWEIHDLFYF